MGYVSFREGKFETSMDYSGDLVLGIIWGPQTKA